MAPPPVKVGWEWTSVKEGLRIKIILSATKNALCFFRLKKNDSNSIMSYYEILEAASHHNFLFKYTLLSAEWYFTLKHICEGN